MGPKLHPGGWIFGPWFFIILKNLHQDLSNEGSNFILGLLKVCHSVPQTWLFFDKLYSVFCVWLWYDHLWLFFLNSLGIFHKTWMLTVILSCWTSLNLNLMKSYNIIKNFSKAIVFQFWKKNIENLWFLTSFGQFFTNYKKILHKTKVQIVILRCLVYLNLNCIKGLHIILLKTFSFIAENVSFHGVISQSQFWHLGGKPALIFSKWLFFQKKISDFMRHIIR